MPEPTRRSADEAFAAALRGFGPPGILALLVIVAGSALTTLFSALLVLAWARASRTPWAELGLARPRSWTFDLAIGLVLGGILKLALKSIVMPLLGAPAINPTYHDLAGNTAALPGMLFALIIVAGFGEETFYRGFLIERLRRLLGPGSGAKLTIVAVTSALFGLAHLADQGVPGMQQAWITGLVFGSVYALTGRLWLVMAAHAAYDVVALALIYWSREAAVAHFFFR